jgi:hypothetical protein
MSESYSPEPRQTENSPLPRGYAAITRARAMSLGGLGAGLALLIALVFIFDQPFLGDVSVTPDAIVKALAAMRAS